MSGLTLSSDKSYFSSSEEGNTYTKGNFYPAFRQFRRGQRTLPGMFIPKCLQLKIILLPKGILWNDIV